MGTCNTFKNFCQKGIQREMSISQRDKWGFNSYFKLGSLATYQYADGNNSVERDKWMMQMTEGGMVVQCHKVGDKG